jgi:hypothetical protein
MSDYLWDKTGEPDAEAERLENLLGQLRFQPTPFDLPAELPARAPRKAETARRVLSWPRLALAASLTLAALAGAWLLLRQQAGLTSDAPQAAAQNKQTDVIETPSPAAPQTTASANESTAGVGKGSDETPAAAPKAGDKRREERGAGGQRPRLPDLDTPRRARRAAAPHVNRPEEARAPKRRERLTPAQVEPVRREETAAEREAVEKVLYALRVTSEQLNYAREQVQGAGRGEANR